MLRRWPSYLAPGCWQPFYFCAVESGSPACCFLHNRNPQRRLLIWLIFPLLRISKRIAGTGIHPDLTQAGIPADPFEMLLYDNWVDAAARFKQNLEEEYDNREIASQIKFSMLQHQINPHFLYNTLDSVRGLAYAEGADSAAEMAEALAAFFGTASATATISSRWARNSTI